MIVFPTAHEGGALAIRQEEVTGDKSEIKEWIFDLSALLANSTESSLAYVAFFSDVEHEVLPVTSGYRVTITYNLYWAAEESSPRTLSVPKSVPTNEETFRTSLRALLDDPTFLPEGAVLLYGLHYKYPLDAHKRPEAGRKALTDLTTRLKACDAVVYKVAQELGLPARLGVLYQTTGIWGYETTLVLCDSIAPLQRHQQIDDPLWKTLERFYGGELMTRPRFMYEERPIPNVKWITPAPGYAQQETQYMAYGNEATLKTTYWQVCLRLSVGPVGDRSGKPRDLPPPEKKPWQKKREEKDDDEEEEEEVVVADVNA